MSQLWRIFHWIFDHHHHVDSHPFDVELYGE